MKDILIYYLNAADILPKVKTFMKLKQRYRKTVRKLDRRKKESCFLFQSLRKDLFRGSPRSTCITSDNNLNEGII